MYMHRFLSNLPPRSRYRLILVVAILLTCYTSYKISMMSQIRGWIPGATTQIEQVTQKHVSDGRRGEAYWVSWTNDNIQTPGNHRLNLALDQWQDIAIGDQIEIVYASGSSSPETRDGIYAENGSFVIDGLLLLGEIIVAIVMIVRLYKLRSQPASA